MTWIRMACHSFILNLQICYLKNCLWREHSTKWHIRHNVGLWVRCCFTFIWVNWASIKLFHFNCLKISKTSAVIKNLECWFVKIKKFGISISDFLHELYWRFLNELCSCIRRYIWNLNMIPCWLRKSASDSKTFSFTRHFQSIN